MDLQRIREAIFLQLLQKTNPWEQPDMNKFINDLLERTERIIVVLEQRNMELT